MTNRHEAAVLKMVVIAQGFVVFIAVCGVVLSEVFQRVFSR